MLRTLSLALLGLALCANAYAETKKGEKEDPKDAKLVVGKVKAVNTAKGTLTLTVSGKDRVFLIKKDTRIVGPRGGKSEDRLKDDRLAKGAEVKILPAADGKTAKEVKLGFRKRTTKKDKDKKE